MYGKIKRDVQRNIENTVAEYEKVKMIERSSMHRPCLHVYLCVETSQSEFVRFYAVPEKDICTDDLRQIP